MIDAIIPTYYEISLKRDRINQLTAYENFKFIEMDISSKEIDDLRQILYAFCGIVNNYFFEVFLKKP